MTPLEGTTQLDEGDETSVCKPQVYTEHEREKEIHLLYRKSGNYTTSHLRIIANKQANKSSSKKKKKKQK